MIIQTWELPLLINTVYETAKLNGENFFRILHWKLIESASSTFSFAFRITVYRLNENLWYDTFLIFLLPQPDFLQCSQPSSHCKMYFSIKCIRSTALSRSFVVRIFRGTSVSLKRNCFERVQFSNATIVHAALKYPSPFTRGHIKGLYASLIILCSKIFWLISIARSIACNLWRCTRCVYKIINVYKIE